MRLFLHIALVLGVGVSVPAQGPADLTPAEQALMQAAFQGNLEAVKHLVSEGVAVDTVDSEKHTPMMWAAFNGHTAVVRFLLDSGAEVDRKDANGRTALLYASSGPFEETVELLLKAGADVNVRGTLEGFTALMTAAAEGEVGVVKLLLRHGADPAIKDKDGDTAASFARQKGHTAVVDVLNDPPPPVRQDPE